MRRRCLALLIAGLVLGPLHVAQAQTPQPIPAAAPLRFESWQPAFLDRSSGTALNGQLSQAPKDAKRQALIGGAIGAAVGVLGCTVVSTLSNDSADGGLSFCPLDSYLLIGGAGFVVGAAIGWAI
jgi:hypothetical protein